MQVRFDKERGIYRDCRWCGGSGCISCSAEAEKAYQRAFPDGPKPIATFKTGDPIVARVLGKEALEGGVDEVLRRAILFKKFD